MVLVCVLALLPLHAAGYLAPVDAGLSSLFDSVLAPSMDVSGPLPRELSLRRLVDKMANLVASEGGFVDRKSLMEIALIADRAGLRCQLPPSLILSVIHSESRFHRKAISPQGAIGLMQIQLPTAQYIASEAGIDAPTRLHHLFDPERNILIGTLYLRELIDRFGDLKTALAAYHVGPTEIGRRLDVQEPFSDRYGKEIREREFFYTTAAPPVTAPPVAAPPVIVASASTVQG